MRFIVAHPWVGVDISGPLPRGGSSLSRGVAFMDFEFQVVYQTKPFPSTQPQFSPLAKTHTPN